MTVYALLPAVTTTGSSLFPSEHFSPRMPSRNVSAPATAIRFITTFFSFFPSSSSFLSVFFQTSRGKTPDQGAINLTNYSSDSRISVSLFGARVVSRGTCIFSRVGGTASFAISTYEMRVYIYIYTRTRSPILLYFPPTLHLIRGNKHFSIASRFADVNAMHNP